MKFNGNIIIADPCYVVKDDALWSQICEAINKADPDEYRGKGNSDILKNVLGVDGLIASTIYGDWGCTVYKEEDDTVLGEFCADAGLVCVMYEEDVLRLNPRFKENYGGWCHTLIENFDGEVTITNLGGNSIWYSDVRVIGEGSVNFYSKQTAG